MSLHLEFEPHSWYMGFAIRDNLMGQGHIKDINKWTAYTDNGMYYTIDEVEADTLKDLKLQIRNYWREQGSVYYNKSNKDLNRP